jgi:hypothetical protein
VYVDSTLVRIFIYLFINNPCNVVRSLVLKRLSRKIEMGNKGIGLYIKHLGFSALLQKLVSSLNVTYGYRMQCFSKVRLKKVRASRTQGKPI